MENLKNRKVAIVHDYLNQYGGAERALEAMHEMYPSAPIYTTIYLPENLPRKFRKMDIRPSFMQELPFLREHFKKYLLLYPFAIRSFDLSSYDVVLSSSSAFAKGANTGSAFHICYCYTPMRFAWRFDDYIKKEQFSPAIKKLLPLIIKFLKIWDLWSSSKVDNFIATSKNIRGRIQDIYNRDAEVIYPPVAPGNYYKGIPRNYTVGNFGASSNSGPGNYFLLVSRLVPYKRIDIVVKAFNSLGLPLRIIGEGPHRQCLESMANSNVKFLGRVSDEVLVENYSACQAVISPGEEDFGLVPVEAMASGKPVIAYAGGGVLETVTDGISGIFFHEQTPEAVFDAVARFGRIHHVFNSDAIRERALVFDREVFKEKLNGLICEKYEEYLAREKRGMSVMGALKF